MGFGGVAVVAGLVAAALALAGPNTGKLSVVEVEDGADMAGPNDLAVSRDGRNVYVAAYDEPAIVTFKRKPKSGRLRFVESDLPANAAEIGDVEASQDGEFVYVTEAADDGSILIFERRARQGKLKLSDRREHNDGDILAEVYGLDISPDGDNVYASSDARLITYRRNERTGKLSLVEQDDEPALSESGSPVVSPDGRNVYVPGSDQSTLLTYERNPNNGRLKFVNGKVDGVANVDGIQGLYGIGVSRDGANVYATGNSESAVATFKRNRTSGKLRFVEALFDDEGPIESMADPYDVLASRDGKNVYVAGYDEDSVTIFRRKADGTLRFLQARNDTVDSSPSGPYRMDLSRDDRHLYTADYSDDAVAVLKRRG
jgi:6-phosphogluconolactonase (cycloisomerase 2 family)